MAKVGIGKHNDDKDVNLSTRGLINALTVEVVDASGNQVTSFGTDEVTLEGNTAVGDGRQSVTTAGSRVQLSTSSVACKRVVVQALETNTGTVVVGGATVVAAAGSRQGYAIYPTQSVLLTVSNLNLIYLDSTANGDVVHYIYEN